MTRCPARLPVAASLENGGTRRRHPSRCNPVRSPAPPGPPPADQAMRSFCQYMRRTNPRITPCWHSPEVGLLETITLTSHCDHSTRTPAVGPPIGEPAPATHPIGVDRVPFSGGRQRPFGFGRVSWRRRFGRPNHRAPVCRPREKPARTPPQRASFPPFAAAVASRGRRPGRPRRGRRSVGISIPSA